MKIGVVSDTHIPKRARELPLIILNAFETVDHIIHAGDILSMHVIQQLEQLAPVTAVAGNVDTSEVKEALGEKKILIAGAFHIGVVHGHGSGGSTIGRAIRAFQQDKLDCIVFGHSHIPFIGHYQNTFMFNPGSPTDKRRCSQFSFGIFETSQGIEAKHIFFD